MLERLNEIFTETREQMDCEMLEHNGKEDHVHLMVTAHPKIAVANLAGKLKGKSSFYLRKELGSNKESALGQPFLVTKLLCCISGWCEFRCGKGLYRKSTHTTDRTPGASV